MLDPELATHVPSSSSAGWLAGGWTASLPPNAWMIPVALLSGANPITVLLVPNVFCSVPVLVSSGVAPPAAFSAGPYQLASLLRLKVPLLAIVAPL